MIGRIDKYRCSSNPRVSDLLYFCFENENWTVENALTASKAFIDQFKNVSIDAYRVLEPTYSDVQYRLVIEALFADEHERRQILYQEGDFQQDYSLVKSGMIVFKKYENEQQEEQQEQKGSIYIKRDPNLVLSSFDTGSSFMTEEVSVNDDSDVLTNNKILRAHVLSALPKVPEYTRYIFRLLPLDLPGHAQSIVQQAIVERHKRVIYNNCKISKDTNEEVLLSKNNNNNSTSDVGEAAITECIMDIFIETSSLIPATSNSSSQQLWVRDSEVMNHSIYYSGTVCIVLKNPVTLYDERKCQASLEMYGGQTFYSSMFSRHYLYCERCQCIDIHSTSDCPI
ncbi:hypothetical protein INT45_004957 [Circinella minor]|uniref:Uncharacterized protein n=1 Tax=Circinella minor TaxID=1195481 RepID=A0A8H7VIF6_9FUNG|nr:hypothetical protein INT45_004957 [Circinella minor]